MAACSQECAYILEKARAKAKMNNLKIGSLRSWRDGNYIEIHEVNGENRYHSGICCCVTQAKADFINAIVNYENRPKVIVRRKN